MLALWQWQRYPVTACNLRYLTKTFDNLSKLDNSRSTEDKIRFQSCFNHGSNPLLPKDIDI